LDLKVDINVSEAHTASIFRAEASPENGITIQKIKTDKGQEPHRWYLFPRLLSIGLFYWPDLAYPSPICQPDIIF
jgi:hypothetical protein